MSLAAPAHPHPTAPRLCQARWANPHHASGVGKHCNSTWNASLGYRKSFSEVGRAWNALMPSNTRKLDAPWHSTIFFKEVQHIDNKTRAKGLSSACRAPHGHAQQPNSSCWPRALPSCPPTIPLEPCHAQVAVVTSPESLCKGVVLNFQLSYL